MIRGERALARRLRVTAVTVRTRRPARLAPRGAARRKDPVRRRNCICARKFIQWSALFPQRVLSKRGWPRLRTPPGRGFFWFTADYRGTATDSCEPDPLGGFARHDPRDISGSRRSRALPVAASHCRENVFRNPDVARDAQQNLSVSQRRDESDPPGWRRPAADSADIDFHREVPGAGAVFGQADHHQAERLERGGHV